jgi:hypothetical protein
MSLIKTKNLLYLLILLLSVITSCNDSGENTQEATINSFTLQPEFNSSLDEVVVGEISDNTIKLSVPYRVSLNNLVVSFNYVGIKVEVNNIEQISDITSNDFSQKLIYKVIGSNGEITEYTVTATNKPPRLPKVYVNVEGNQEYSDDEKENYKNITLRVLDSDNYYTTNTDFIAKGEMKGRGNSTWYGVPKKPFRIKLEEKSSLLGMSNDKNWALLANYYDKTLLRNITALARLPYPINPCFIS